MRFAEIKCHEINSQNQLKMEIIFTITALWLKRTIHTDNTLHN